MTKVRNTLWAAALLLVLTVPAFASGQPTISGPEVAVVGENVMLTIDFPSGDYQSISGKLDWDSKMLQLQGYEISPSWEAAFLEKGFTLTQTQHGVRQDPWIRLTYRLGNTPVGTKVSFSCLDVVADNQISYANAMFTFTVGKHLSHDNTLTQLTLENGKLSPQFHPEITAYTAQVNPGQTRLLLQAVPAQNAAVEVDAPQLSGENVTRVTITVTAENGDERIYRIDVEPVEEATAPTQTQETTEETAAQSPTKDDREDKPSGTNFPWWAAVAAVFAGGALGGGIVIVVQEIRKKNR